MTEMQPGQMLGRYRIARKLGSGAFGSVWLAQDSWLGKNVALKLPHRQGGEFDKLIAEPKMLAGLDHPNIIRLLTVEKAEDTVFMVMDYVEGRSLRERLSSGPLPVPEALAIAKGIVAALVYAHSKGVVHRDLKPANILLAADGGIRITDFGTAHVLKTGDEAVAAGTLYYMAKEQLLGRVMPASDVYGVGVMFFEMLTGKLPFHDTSGSRLIQKILSGDPAPSIADIDSKLPKPLARIVARALERDIRKRWRKAEEMLKAIETFEEGGEIPELPAEAAAATHPAYERFSKKIPRLSETLGKTHDYLFRGTIGERGKKDGQFLLPSGVAVSGTGLLLVTDAIKSCVQVFDRQGKLVRRLGQEGTRLEGREGLRFLNPTAITIDREGRVYVCDTKNSQVQVFSDEGETIAYLGRPLVVMGAHEEEGVIGLNYPRGLAIDEERETLYVADTGNNRLRIFRLDGTPAGTFGSLGERNEEFNTPQGLAVGIEGRLYVADSQNHRIQVFDRDCRFHGSFGRRGTGEGAFSRPPTSVAVTVTGELLVCNDTARIRVFDDSGSYLGAVEGPDGTSAGGARYYSAALSGLDDLYAVDEHNCQLHHFEYKERKL